MSAVSGAAARAEWAAKLVPGGGLGMPSPIVIFEEINVPRQDCGSYFHHQVRPTGMDTAQRRRIQAYINRRMYTLIISII